MIQAKEIERYIHDGLVCSYLQVVGDGHHFEAVIVSPLFQGKTRIQQHQLVYQALGERMRAEIHALSMKTFTPEGWKKLGAQHNK